MAIRSEEIASIIKQQIQQFGTDVAAVNVGTVVEAGDGIARVHGLSNVAASELVQFASGVMGLALNLEEDSVGVVVLGDYDEIKEGDEVRATGRIVEVPVGDALLGRVVDALGVPVDGKGPISTTKSRPVERIAPDVTTRQGVDTPVQTGIKAIDGMIPVENVQDPREAWWIALNNIDPERDARFTMGPVDVLDHSSRAFTYGSKMGLDATRKLPEEGFTRNWPDLIVMDDATKARVSALWPSLGLGPR
jgi:hypothetical protein